MHDIKIASIALKESEAQHSSAPRACSSGCKDEQCEHALKGLALLARAGPHRQLATLVRFPVHFEHAVVAAAKHSASSPLVSGAVQTMQFKWST